MPCPEGYAEIRCDFGCEKGADGKYYVTVRKDKPSLIVRKVGGTVHYDLRGLNEQRLCTKCKGIGKYCQKMASYE